MFDILVLFASFQNCFFQAFYAAFGLPTNEFEVTLDLAVEFLFLLDFVFCFCQEYKDDELLIVVSDIKQIAIHYLKGSCFYDLLACLPIAYLIEWTSSG
jgi:hypothetical protein